MKLRKTANIGKSNDKVTFSRTPKELKSSKTLVLPERRKTKFKLALEETLLDNKELRIFLQRENLLELKQKISKKRKVGRPRRIPISPQRVVSIKRALEQSRKVPVSSQRYVKKPVKEPRKIARSSDTTVFVKKTLLNSKKNPVNPQRSISIKKTIDNSTLIPHSVASGKKYLNKKLTRNTEKMVINNGKVSKHNPDDYFAKQLEGHQNDKLFYLKNVQCKSVSEGKLNYKFNQLVNDVKNMQLPTQSWKIKVIIRHNKISAIIFTNKADLERTLSFNCDDDKYHIVIDNKPALFLGSPEKVNNCHDIEVLLSIMETIDKDSPMLLFK